MVVSCLGVAMAYWLLPASIDIIAWPPGGPVRVALFASLFKLWVALATGLVAAVALLFTGPVERTARARIIAPLLLLWLWTLPYWPWLPDRAPALLILAGPLRWVIAAAAVLGVAAAWVREHRIRVGLSIGRGSVFVLSLALYAGLGLWSLASVGPGGDEPHYLIITHSLLVDRDLKIENNHLRGDYRAFWRGELRPDYFVRGQNGAIYSIHSPGLAAVILPGYAIAGARGAVVTMALFGALAAVAIFDVALVIGGPAIALLTWLAVCLTVPFVPHSWMLYPEMAGAAIVAWSVRWLLEGRAGKPAEESDGVPASTPVSGRPDQPPPTRRRSAEARVHRTTRATAEGLHDSRTSPLTWLWRGACLGLLPWLHTKFVVLLAVLALLLLWRLRTRLREASAFAAAVALLSLAWLSYFYVIYGSIDPQVAYGAYAAQNVRFDNLPRSLLGLLIDQKFGLLVYSPVYLLAGLGVWHLARDSRRRGLALALTAVAVPYVIGSARLHMWWGGNSAPARFMVPILPLLAPAIATALLSVRSPLGRATAGLWVAFGLMVAAIGIAFPDRLLLLSDPHGIARFLEAIQGSAPIAAALPTFTQEEWTTPMVRALPWIAAALGALSVAWVASARSRCGPFWIASAEAVAFLIAGSLLSSSSAGAVRADATLRGRLGLMTAYDPDRLRALDYATMAKLDPAALLRASVLEIQPPPDDEIDARGRISAALVLPPGRFEARVWFQGQRPQDGDLLLSARRGDVLARAGGPLANPATLPFALPVRVGVSLSLSEQSSARAVQQVQMVPISIVPRSRRLNIQPRAIESIAGHPGGALVYADDQAYPEGGVFWTRAANRAEVAAVPAGASQLVLTVHVGPIARGVVILTVNGRNLDVEMGPDETRQVVVDVPAGAALVPIVVQAPGFFRPASVDPKSTDTRALGAQVRVELR
ncbi:MAG: hypothetical protein ABI868_23195 [Acidobacteriota bacterium]